MGTNITKVETVCEVIRHLTTLSLGYDLVHTDSPLTYKGVTHVQPRIREVGARLKKFGFEGAKSWLK